jgi:hypothetical protein
VFHPINALQVVGKWFHSLELNIDELVWNTGSDAIPTSACSLPCAVGMIKMQQVCRPLFDLPGTVHSVSAKSSCAKCVGPPIAQGVKYLNNSFFLLK